MPNQQVRYLLVWQYLKYWRIECIKVLHDAADDQLWVRFPGESAKDQHTKHELV